MAAKKPAYVPADFVAMQKDVEYSSQHMNKLDSAFEKLAVISSDMSKLIALHDQRLEKNEPSLERLIDLSDKRRDELLTKVDKVYTDMGERDGIIVKEVKELLGQRKVETDKQFEGVYNKFDLFDKKFDKLMKIIYIGMGGGMIVAALLGNIEMIMKILTAIGKQ